jgi:hypothetical protein
LHGQIFVEPWARTSERCFLTESEGSCGDSSRRATQKW